MISMNAAFLVMQLKGWGGRAKENFKEQITELDK